MILLQKKEEDTSDWISVTAIWMCGFITIEIDSKILFKKKLILKISKKLVLGLGFRFSSVGFIKFKKLDSVVKVKSRPWSKFSTFFYFCSIFFFNIYTKLAFFFNDIFTFWSFFAYSRTNESIGIINREKRHSRNGFLSKSISTSFFDYIRSG